MINDPDRIIYEFIIRIPSNSERTSGLSYKDAKLWKYRMCVTLAREHYGYSVITEIRGFSDSKKMAFAKNEADLVQKFLEILDSYDKKYTDCPDLGTFAKNELDLDKLHDGIPFFRKTKNTFGILTKQKNWELLTLEFLDKDFRNEHNPNANYYELYSSLAFGKNNNNKVYYAYDANIFDLDGRLDSIGSSRFIDEPDVKELYILSTVEDAFASIKANIESVTLRAMKKRVKSMLHSRRIKY